MDIKKYKDLAVKNKYIILTTVFILALAVFFVVRFETSKRAEPQINAVATVKIPTVTLNITGAVGMPGSYEIEAGSSLMDNLELFGGFLENANLDEVNLAEPITKDKSFTIKTRKTLDIDQSDIDKLYQAP